MDADPWSIFLSEQSDPLLHCANLWFLAKTPVTEEPVTKTPVTAAPVTENPLTYSTVSEGSRNGCLFCLRDRLSIWQKVVVNSHKPWPHSASFIYEKIMAAKPAMSVSR